MKNADILLRYIGGYTLEIYVANCMANNIGKCLPVVYYNIMSDLLLTISIAIALILINKQCKNLLEKIL